MGKVSTTTQIFLIYILCVPPLAFGLVSAFLFTPKFLIPLDEKLSIVGGIGPLLIGISLLFLAGIVALNTETDEDVEAGVLFG